MLGFLAHGVKVNEGSILTNKRKKSKPSEKETAEEVGGDTRMQRRIKAQPQETAAYQALIDHKQATLNVLLSQIPDVTTFAQLGELIATPMSGYGNDWSGLRTSSIRLESVIWCP